ncbi:MAG: anion permease [Cyanobacteriota/Melainabacteria group bacterium]
MRPRRALKAMSVLIWMGVWWFTEAIDISATALLPLVLLPILGARHHGRGSGTCAHPLIFLFMGGFLIALSMRKWGMDKRVALITLKVVGTRPRNMVEWIHAGFRPCSGAFVSNTATTTSATHSPFGY